MSNETIIIRDNRRSRFFTVDNEILDAYPTVGCYGILVYIALCRFAHNTTQGCRITLQTIAQRVRISRSSACRGVSELESAGLIRVERVKDQPSTYTLLSVSYRNALVPTPFPIETDPFLSESHNNTKKDKTKNRVEDSSLKREVVKRVFAHYIETIGKSHLYTLIDLRMQKGLARLEECLKKTKGNLADAEQLMMICVDTLAESKFHMGDNAQKKTYNDWEDQLFGSESRMSKWMEEANRG